jgi:hypothetical protein
MVGVLAAAAAAVLLGLGVSIRFALRRSRNRKDLEGHFQGEWPGGERWAPLTDTDP